MSLLPPTLCRRPSATNCCVTTFESQFITKPPLYPYGLIADPPLLFHATTVNPRPSSPRLLQVLLAIGTLAALARLPRLHSVTPYTLLVAAQSVALFAAAALFLWQALRLLPVGYHRLAQHGTQVCRR